MGAGDDAVTLLKRASATKPRIGATKLGTDSACDANDCAMVYYLRRHVGSAATALQLTAGFSLAACDKVRRSASGTGCQMRPRRVRRGATVYEMRAESNSSQLTASDRAVSTPAEAPSTPATDRVPILLASATAAAFAALSVFEVIEKLRGQLAEPHERRQLARTPATIGQATPQRPARNKRV